MPYQLEVQENFSEGVKRVASEELDEALKGLRGETERSVGEAVHDARKRFKKLRATLRLVRSDLGEKRYRRADARFRDAGRALSGLRDADVLLATLDALAKRAGDKTTRKMFRETRKTLAARQQHAVARADVVTAEVAQRVADAAHDIASWPLGDGWDAAGPNLKRSYNRGLKAFGRAYRHPSDDRLHEWRKRVKDLWYHLRLLNPLWPEVMAALAVQAGQLADLLGDEHDLAVLEQTLTDGADFGDVEPIRELIGARRRELSLKAERSGRRLYADEPEVFTRRFRAYWRVWRAEAQGAEETA